MSAALLSLEQTLYHALVPWLNAKRWRVAFSGGMDSAVLLHALWRLQQYCAVPPIEALHIEHGLQEAARAWPAHCAQFCAERGIGFHSIKVLVKAEASVEQAARNARYQAFAESLKAHEVLLCAQHQDDQSETFLFRALRGAGVKGLSAMAPVRPLGAGLLVRPLLKVSRDQIAAYAKAQGLSWVEDPSNAEKRLARNFLRHEVLPIVRQQWPAAAQNLSRASAHLAEAQTLLDELAQDDLARAASAPPFALPYPCLALGPLLALSPARQRNALRYWLKDFTELPDTAHWAGWQALAYAKACATPRWVLGAWALYRADQRLYLAPSALQTKPLPVTEAVAPLMRLPGNGVLSLAGKWQADWQVGYRQGGEILDLNGRGRRDLKRLLNEAKVPEFIRQRLPLLLCRGQVLAVANLPALCRDGIALIWQPETD